MITERMGAELGAKLGQEAGEIAGGEAGSAAGKAEAAKHNVLVMAAEEVEALKVKLGQVGEESGKPSGEKAGKEAAAKIDVPKILQEALAGAQKAADEAAKEAKEKEQAEQAEAVKAMIVNEAKEAGKRVGFQTAQLFIAEELEALILPEITKACEEAGKAKGEEIFGEFGGQVRLIQFHLNFILSCYFYILYFTPIFKVTCLVTS